MGNTADKVIAVALAEEGYLEKSAAAYRKDPTVLYRKMDGAGSDNYTKYGKEMHDIYPAVMDFPAYWCDAFVDWCFYKAYGIATAKSLLGGNFDDYTVASCQMYKNKGALDTTPTVGAQVFFTKNGAVSGCYHTGLIYKVEGGNFYTVEGNTSGASSVVSNGGGVARKSYSIAAYKGKTLFGHPKYDTAASTSTAASTDGNEKAIWDRLMAFFGNAYGAAGIMGNFYAESGLKANNLQNTSEKKLGMTDAQYTAAVDNGTYGNFAKDSAGYGLAQWTYHTLKQGLLDYCKAKGKSIGDRDAQVDFFCKEMKEDFPAVYKTLTTAKTVKEASNAVLLKFERPADQSAAVQEKRAAYGQGYYDRYAKATGYIVQVTASALNVRKGPGTNYGIATTVKKGERYTIVGEQMNGTTKWGKLKSGAGWISLAYTKAV